MRAELTEVVACSPERLWEVVVDVERWPALMDHVRELGIDGGGPLRPGSTATVRQRMLPAATWTVTELHDRQRFTWTSRFLRIRWTGDHVLEPVDADRTRLTLAIDAEGTVIRVLGPLLRRPFATALDAELAGLRRGCGG